MNYLFVGGKKRNLVSILTHAIARNHKSALLPTCSVPIQAYQCGQFQNPVDFIISNVFPLKLPFIYLRSKGWQNRKKNTEATGRVKKIP